MVWVHDPKYNFTRRSPFIQFRNSASNEPVVILNNVAVVVMFFNYNI